jgi:Ca2+-binding RTX toxin-like protein
MIKLEFGEFAVNMKAPAALDAALFSDFAEGFDIHEDSSGPGQTFFQETGGSLSRVKLVGSFNPDNPGPTDAVNNIEIYSEADAGGGTWRLIVTGLSQTFGTVFNDFMTNGNLGVLYEGQAVEIHGSGFGDTLEGGGLGDILIGNGGADRLYGGAGADTMNGGAGNDTFYVNATSDKVIELAGGGTDTVRSTVGETLDAGVEKLVLLGSGNIKGTGNSSANTLIGNSGNNTLDGKGSGDTLNGMGGADKLVWSAADRYDGGAGNSDMLRVDGSGVLINLQSLPSSRVKNIEIINLTGSGDNDLILSLQDVLDSSNDTLRVMGNAGDSVQHGGGWTSAGEVIISGNTYSRFTQSGATLLVDTDISLSA